MEKILKAISGDAKAILLDIVPLLSCEVNDCFNNVNKVIRAKGGDVVYGWKLHLGKYVHEAECHAVWKNKEGKLIDVTPVDLETHEIYFVEDHSGWEFNGVPLDNIRVNVTNNEVVDDLIKLAELETALWLKSQNNNQFKLSENDIKSLNILHLKKRGLVFFLERGGTLKSKCYCRSGKIYEDCCRIKIL